MKKNIIIATLVAASALLASISCTKQDDVQSVSEAKVFTATIEQELTKTMLKEGSVFWDEKDLININGASYSATPNRDKPESATFTFVDGIAPTAPYCAIYPASLWDNGKYFFPSVQNYSEGKFNAPMYAQSSSEKLIFNNICGVICLRLRSSDNSETVVRRIVLTTKGEKVWGDFKVNTNVEEKWEASVFNEGDQSNTVTLDCGEDGISLNPHDAKEFFIYLPPQHYQSGMTVSIESTNTDCSAYEMHTNYEVSVDCNSVYSFDWTVQFQQSATPAVQYVPRYPTGSEIPHVFSVGPNSIDKVYFTKGNLGAHYYNEGYSWYFAENQYDFIGNNSGNASLINGGEVGNDEYVDLFCWSTDENIWGIESNATGDFYDWGRNFDPVVYRTLTADEWNYLFNTRVFINDNVEHTGEGYSYKILSNAVIGDETVSGIIIFPDGFSDQQDWQTEYTSWSAIANAGIVFLPRTGFWYDEVNGSEFNTEDLAYWAASSQNEQNAYCVFYYCSLEATGYLPKKCRCAVRLVANAFVPDSAPAPEEIVEEEQSVEGK